VKGDFEFELGALHMHMMVEVHVVLAPFVAFTYSYNANKAHNMLTLMLDPGLKSLDVVKAFVGWANVIQIVIEYVSKTLLPLLVATFHFLTPTYNGMTIATPIDDSIFGAMTLNATIVHMLLKNELGLFFHLHVKPKDFCTTFDLVEVPRNIVSKCFFCGLIDFGDSWVPN